MATPQGQQQTFITQHWQCFQQGLLSSSYGMANHFCCYSTLHHLGAACNLHSTGHLCHAQAAHMQRCHKRTGASQYHYSMSPKQVQQRTLAQASL
jgi:hypothetical protein